MSKIAIGGMVETPALVLLKVLGARRGPGVAGLALSTLGAHGVNVLCVVSSSGPPRPREHDRGGEPRRPRPGAGPAAGRAREIDAERIEVVRNCCLISVYGPHFSERPSIAGMIFDALAEGRIDIHAVSTSVSTVSCLIDQDDLERARRQLQSAFLLP
ncbi:MAG: ACT domain-containing protein [bacterium]|nr:ACT domain-containing protein [bacterium]